MEASRLKGYDSYREVDARALQIPKRELYRAMGYGRNVPEKDICDMVDELFDEALTIAKPSYYYTIDRCEVADERLRVDGGDFVVSRTIATLLKGSEFSLLFVATAGEAFGEWMESKSAEGDMIATFIIDAIGSTIVEAVGDYMEEDLNVELVEEGLKHTNRFSPGYCGWRIEEQQLLFSLFPSGVCGVSLSATSLMHPIKSISGAIGIGESVKTKRYGCAICERTDCYMRR